MNLPLWGREASVENLRSWTDDPARSLLVEIVAPEGAGAGRLLDAMATALEDAGFDVHTASGDPTASYRPDALTDDLGDLAATDRRLALAISNADLADATSLGKLSRVLADRPGTVVILERTPLEGIAALPFQQLTMAAARMADTHEITLERLTAPDVAAALHMETDAAQVLLSAAGGTDAGLVGTLTEAGEERLPGDLTSLEGFLSDLARKAASPTAGLDDVTARLVEAVTVANAPVRIDTLAAALGTDERSTLTAGEQATAQGLATESAGGFGPAHEPARTQIGESLGSARRAQTAVDLADAMETSGEARRNPGTVGMHLLSAERWERALPYLAEAGLDLTGQGATFEGAKLVDGALRCVDEGADIDPDQLGRLLLARAQFYRNTGYPQRAQADLERAVETLTGPARIDALGFLAAILDDAQRPQASEAIVATAEWEAASQGATEKLGSLLTFRGREAERLGFAAEADRMLDAGSDLVDLHGTETQRFNATTNRAWIAFDRGQVRLAEQLFSRLAEDAEGMGGPAMAADRLAWHARSLFAAGHPTAAIEAMERANTIADERGLHVTRFLTAIATAEGGILYGRPEEALAAARDEMALVELLLPAWRNGTHYREAAAHAVAGSWDEAAESVQAALDTTPAGPDGLRWRLRIQALEMRISHARTGAWDRTAAEELTDQLLVSGWLGGAAELMTWRAGIEEDADLGVDAAALAMQLGNPVQAAAAIQAAGAWDQPEAAPVATAIHRVDESIPEEWQSAWRALPHVAGALAAEPRDPEAADLDGRLQEALTAAGLADPDAVFSPAQRVSGGMVRRVARPRRRIRPLVAAAVIVGVIALGGLAGYLGGALRPADEPEATPTTVATTAATTTTTTTIPTLENTVLPTPDILAGQAPFLGGPEQSGVYPDATGVPEVGGHYWEYDLGGPTRSAPVVFGDSILIGAGDGNVYSIGTDGNFEWQAAMSDAIDAPVAVAQLSFGGSGALGAESETIIIAADRAGRVDALTTDGRQEWSEDVGGPITSVPTIVGNTVVVATTSGELVALDGPGGTELWRYPSEEDDQPITSLEFGAALADGILYAAGSDAVVAVDAASGSYVCHSRTPDRATAPSTIANGHVYTPVGASVHVMQIGTCQLRADGGQVALQMGVQTVTSPAVLDDVMYIGSGLLIAAFDTFSGEEAFPSSSVFTGAQVLGSPIIAGDVVYAGSSDQFVYAVDRTSWDELWKYDTGGIVAAPVAVVDDAVFVLNRSGKLIALGPASSE